MAGYTKYRTVPYKKGQKEVYKLSRSKIELFMQCPRCFWIDVRLKIKRPSSPPFNINKAIDELFKKEFDYYRAKKEPHPMMVEAGIDAIPYATTKLDKWRRALGNDAGVDTVHKPTNLHIYGAVDDVWIDNTGHLIVVDYKATAKAEPVKSLGAEGTWYDTYRRQMEIYQWLLRQNGFEVSDTGYFVYATGSSAHDKFDNVVNFETNVFPHHGNTDWVEQTLVDIKAVMDSDEMPSVGKRLMDSTKDCEFCEYAKSRTQLTLNAIQHKNKKKRSN